MRKSDKKYYQWLLEAIDGQISSLMKERAARHGDDAEQELINEALTNLYAERTDIYKKLGQ